MASSKPAAVAVKKALEETVVEKGGQKVHVTRDLTKLAQISINTGRKTTPEQTGEPGDENEIKGPVNSFTKEQFQSAWNTLAQDIKSQGKDSLYITLTKRPPVVDEEYKIILIIDNKTQEQSLEREKQTMLEYLRAALNNYAIVIDARIEESNDDAFLYTTKDKFKKLAEKNPHLLMLQKRLNLDIDF
jgi:hypothetical protein